MAKAWLRWLGLCQFIPASGCRKRVLCRRPEEIAVAWAAVGVMDACGGRRRSPLVSLDRADGFDQVRVGIGEGREDGGGLWMLGRKEWMFKYQA